MPLRLSGLSSGMDTESIVQELMKAQRLKSTKLENKVTTLDWKQEKWKALNTKIYSFYTGPLAKLKMQGSFQTKKGTSSDESKLEVKANSNAAAGTHKIEVKAVASAQFITGSKLGVDTNGKEIKSSTKLTDLGFEASENTVISVKAGSKNAVTLNVDADATVQDFITTCQDAGLYAQYDTDQKRFFISSKESGNENAFSITSSSTVDNNLSFLGLSEIVSTADVNGVVTTTVGAGVKLVGSSDASIVYNGAEIKSSSNTISVNGLTLTVKGVTEGANTPDTADDKPINVLVSDDSQAVYDMIKGFVKSYNELLKELNDVYSADKAKGYEPLTDEQKEAMTDDQIKNWEDKIKNSLLRRDTSVDSIVNAMRSSFSMNVKVGNVTHSLSASFGIVTTDYTEKGLLHIQGDTEDSEVTGTEDKLLKALNDDPEAVMEVFNKIAGELYDTMTEKMSRTELNSALTFYNDKELKNTKEKYEKELSVLEKKLIDMENRYYKQFTAMEKAMAEMNSQSSALASMLGTNQQ